MSSIITDEQWLGKTFSKFWELSRSDPARYYYEKLIQPKEVADIGVFLVSGLTSAINGTAVVADKDQLTTADGEKLLGHLLPIKPLDLD